MPTHRLATCLVLALAGTASTLSAAAPTPRPGKMDVQPPRVSLRHAGDGARLVVTAVWPGGVTDRTRQVSYSPADPAVVSVSEDGVIRAKKAGSTTITVREAGLSVAVPVEVTGGDVPPVSFVNDVMPLLACAGITNVSNAFAGIGNPLVVLFDFESGKQKQQLKPKAAFNGTMWGVSCHPSGTILGVAGGNGGQLYAWKPTEAASFHVMALPNNARDLDVCPDQRQIAIPFQDGFLRTYDLGPKKA